MLIFKPSIIVYRKDEETNRRNADFPYTSEQVKNIKSEVMRLLHGVHLVDEDGNIYVLHVNDIE